MPALIISACSDWLDVKPRNQTAADELFSTYSGFTSALNGCYILLKQRDLYGEKLTMTDIECMAQLWRIATAESLYDKLSNFKYDDPDVKEETAVIYEKLYYIIAQANMIIASIEKNGSAIPDKAERAMFEAEAYAIRAFCHFDALRLFGQLPQGGTLSVKLPYAEKVSKVDLPAYYSFDDFAKKIEADLTKALELLDGNDPVFKTPFLELNSGTDIFNGWRQFRFNYWAVKAIMARFYLYLGDSQSLGKAYGHANDILTAKGADGKALLTLGGLDAEAAGEPIATLDISQGYYASPSECLLMLNAYSIMDYISVIGTGTASGQIRDYQLVMRREDLNTLFSGQGDANNRLNKVWITNNDVTHNPCGVLQKYYYDILSDVIIAKQQVIPLLRLSEMYLIVMETTTNLTEANTLYFEYMYSHNVHRSTLNEFTSLDAVRSWVFDEYRREFVGEGQMFFTYKRNGSTTMSFPTAKAVTENDYIVPLPNTEYDPNK